MNELKTADCAICDSYRDGQARPAFMIPSATGLSPDAHHAQYHGGEPAPKRVTKEFFKDLLAGGIAGAFRLITASSGI